MQQNDPFLPQNLHPHEGNPLKHPLQHTFLYDLGIDVPITQDICYTWLSGWIFFCV